MALESILNAVDLDWKSHLRVFDGNGNGNYCMMDSFLLGEKGLEEYSTTVVGMKMLISTVLLFTFLFSSTPSS